MMQREELFTKAEALADDPDSLPPIYIRSHARADKLDTLRRFPFLASRATLVVAEDEYVDYVLEWPDVATVAIPESYPGEKSAGRAIQFILDEAHDDGHEHIIILDDDLMSIAMLYEEHDGSVSRAVKKWLPFKADREHYYHGLLALFVQAARDAYDTEPTAALAGVQVQSPSWIRENADTMWRLNAGPVFPSQMMSVHVPRFMEMVGGVDPDFWEHGDDLSMTADLLAAGGSTVLVPSVITGWRSYETESVIRDELTAPAYRQREHDLIMAKPLGRDGYIRTRYDDQGRPWWHRINWTKLRRAGKVRVTQRMWDGTVVDGRFETKDIKIAQKYWGSNLAELESLL